MLDALLNHLARSRGIGEAYHDYRGELRAFSPATKTAILAAMGCNVTDVTATDGALRAIALPPALEPDVAYGAAVVTGAENPDGAKTFIDGLLHGDGAAALQKAGFKPPPG